MFRSCVLMDGPEYAPCRATAASAPRLRIPLDLEMELAVKHRA